MMITWDNLASEEAIQKTIEALKNNGIEAMVVENKTEALAKIKKLIPSGVSVMNGASKTLEQIGFVDYLKSGAHGWTNLHEAITEEKDKEKQSQFRKLSLASDYYLGSVHALSQDGQMVIASNTGSQLPNIVFGSQNLIFVVSTKKIVPTLADAIERLEKHVFPQEDASIRAKYGIGAQISKLLIFKKENPMLGRKVRVILVKEKLGF